MAITTLYTTKAPSVIDNISSNCRRKAPPPLMHMVCAVKMNHQFIVWRNICKLAMYGRLLRREAALSSAHFPGGGLRIWKGWGCLLEILNETPKGDRSRRGPSFFWPLKETMLNNKLVIIFTRDQIIVLSQQPSFVLYSCKAIDKDVLFKYWCYRKLGL